MLWWIIGAVALGGVGMGVWRYFGASDGTSDSSTGLLSDSDSSDSTSGSGDTESSDSSSSDSGGGDSGGGGE